MNPWRPLRKRHLPALAATAAALRAAAVVVALPGAAPAAAQTGCRFVLGFGALSSQIAARVGNCLDNERSMANGDSTQPTSTGLLTWRRANNFTAFTDGADIWVTTPNGARATISGPAADLRAVLGQLLSEHADIAVVAMQKGHDGSSDFAATAAQLDQNSVALGDAIASVYGRPAGDAFLAQWRDHIRMFVDYTVGTAKNDAPMKAKALAELNGYRESFGKFMETANPNLPSDVVAGLLQEHVNQLVSALDSYAAKDYATAYVTVSRSHAHMFKTGDGLAGGIVKQFPENFVP